MLQARQTRGPDADLGLGLPGVRRSGSQLYLLLAGTRARAGWQQSKAQTVRRKAGGCPASSSRLGLKSFCRSSWITRMDTALSPQTAGEWREQDLRQGRALTHCLAGAR